MSHFVEVLDHPALTAEERKLIGMKGRVLARRGHHVTLYLTDNREVSLPDTALRPVPKKKTFAEVYDENARRRGQHEDR